MSSLSRINVGQLFCKCCSLLILAKNVVFIFTKNVVFIFTKSVVLMFAKIVMCKSKWEKFAYTTTTILTKSLGMEQFCKTLKFTNFPAPPSTHYAMLIWSALNTQNHCRRFQHCLEKEGGGAVTKTVSYKQSNRLMQGVFHKFLILHVLLLGVHFWPGL